MHNHEPDNRLERTEGIIENNALAVRDMLVTAQSQQTQISQLTDTISKTSSRLTLFNWINLAIITILGIGSASLTKLSFSSISQHNEFDKDQRALEVTLQLATYWENNLDAETRRRAIRIVENGAREKLLKYLAKADEALNPQEMKEDKDILQLLELNSTAKDSTVINEAILYRVALTRVLNTMESLANIRNHTESKITNEILDKGYKCTFKIRYEQLKPFVNEFRKNHSKTTWEPIDTVIQTTWKSFDECK